MLSVLWVNGCAEPGFGRVYVNVLHVRSVLSVRGSASPGLPSRLDASLPRATQAQRKLPFTAKWDSVPADVPHSWRRSPAAVCISSPWGQAWFWCPSGVSAVVPSLEVPALPAAQVPRTGAGSLCAP